MREREFQIPVLPADPVQAIAVLNVHIGRLNGVIAELLAMQSPIKTSPPLRPRTGMIAYADGTVWNPGAGEGHYEYRSDGLWHKL